MGEINRFQKQRADWILPRIKEGATILDIGSGDGAVLTYLMERKSLTVTATDISDHALAFLTSKGIKAVKHDFQDMASVASLPAADHVILFEVLEHMKDPETFLRTIQTKAGISIFFSVPNTGYFPHRLRLLLGSFPMQWKVHPGEHVRFWTKKDLAWWLRELGYENRSEVHIYDGIPVLNRIWGAFFGMCFVGEIRSE